ncbi:hypothetical protein C1I98_18365 [Spongiactinospora gelatinilytica]|uniref:MFS transporter n=2 Tax=Spongiactinospora gelatinilytica TaxID=2666298 RepID=A0A2W2H1N6_9ACTN|nr:hypothetical protein C1I98_18365 [Spongiactinospora gelatinilytica]
MPTGATIWLVPAMEQAAGWRWAFAVLALGPLAGIMAMARLIRHRHRSTGSTAVPLPADTVTS